MKSFFKRFVKRWKLKEYFGIKRPSRIFADLGRQFTSGIRTAIVFEPFYTNTLKQFQPYRLPDSVKSKAKIDCYLPYEFETITNEMKAWCISW